MKVQPDKESSKSIRKSRMPKRVLIILAIVLGAGVIGVIGVIVSAHQHNVKGSSCESIDPTGCIIEAKVRNDTNLTYTVKQCKDDIPCKSFADVTTLQPGDSHSANGSTDGTPQPWVVFDKQEKIAGCLNLEFVQHTASSVVVPLSKMLTCKEVSNSIAEFKKTYKAF